ncbi:MAG: DUF5916 domain-containing protein [Bacteroidetes bacterium]|nr:DUF5916 domain-containing protein [Bacteroidota bacterium]
MHALLLATLMFFQQAATYSGTQNKIDVDIPRLEAEGVQVDGVLDEEVWAQAARLTDFSQYQPVDGRPASDPTEVLVWYAADAIYFGIKATELHGDVVRATQANRDNIASEDHVQILLDTQNDNQIGYLFGVNALGVQQDGTRSDQFGGGAGGRSATGGGSSNINALDGSVDLNPDYTFTSRGRLTPTGYEVEIRIPFKSLRYQGAEVQEWGIHVLRKVQHSGFQDTWAPAVRANASFLGQSGSLKGLRDMNRGLVLDVVPTVTSAFNGAENPSGDWEYADDTQFGADVKWGIRQNLTLNGTINPDFSQVEADVGQVVLNERFALFFPEKRPFFLEGLELFDTPGQMIYTRRIVAPGGKVGKLNVATILAADDQDFSASGSDNPLFGVVRLRRDLNGNNTAGVVLTTREDGDRYSRLAGADGRFYHGGKYYVEAQAVGSWTDTGAGSVSGSFSNLSWDRTGRRWGFNYAVKAISPDFRAAAGFVNRTGVVDAHAYNRLSFYGEEGALVETVGGFVGITRIWDHADTGAGPIEGSDALWPSATLRGGWRLNGALTRSFYSYLPGSYDGYDVVASAGAATAAAFVVPDKETDQFSGSIGVTTPTFQLFTLSLNVAHAQIPIFSEASKGASRSYTVALDARPTSAIRASFQMQHYTLERKVDGSQYSKEIIPRLKVEYQLTPDIFVRVIGQYAAREREALKDREGNLIRINGELTSDTESNDLRMDWLFSYRPNPGTLLYLGYGSTMEDAGQQRFQDLRRLNDGFFLKLSYLFRVG